MPINMRVSTQREALRTQDLDEKMNRVEISQLVIVRVDTDAEEQPRIPSIDDLVVPELAVREFRSLTYG